VKIQDRFGSYLNLEFLKPREKFLVLGLSPQRTTAALLGLDDDKKITLEKFWDDFSLKGLQAHSIQQLKKRKLIVSADPALTTTVSVPVELARRAEDAANPIVLEEIETLLAQAMGRLFIAERAAAAKRLGGSDLDTILVNAKTGHWKIDRHAVMNPEGFTGKKIEAVLDLTFTTRGIFEWLKPFFNAREGFFFTETPRAGLQTLLRFEEAPLALIEISAEGSVLFMIEKTAWGTAVVRENVGWPMRTLFERITEAVPTSREVVLELYDRHLRGEMAEHAHRAFTKIMKPELDAFLARVGKSKLKGRAYLHSPLPLPVALPFKEGRVELGEIPLASVLAKSGFFIDAKDWPFAAADIFMTLAPFLEFYYDKSGSEVNNKLRRRVHWLIQ